MLIKLTIKCLSDAKGTPFFDYPRCECKGKRESIDSDLAAFLDYIEGNRMSLRTFLLSNL